MAFEIVIPDGLRDDSQVATAPRVETLDRLRVGFLVNEKGDATATNFELDSHIIENRLRRDFAPESVVRYIKGSAFKPASREVIDNLAREADVVINGIGK